MKTLDDMKKELDKLQKEKTDFEINKNLANAQVQSKFNLAKELDEEIKKLKEQKESLTKDVLQGKESILRELKKSETSVTKREEEVKVKEAELRKEENFFREEKSQLYSKLQDAHNTKASAEELVRKIKDFASTIK